MAYENALAALADPTRRAVFERLRAGALPVGDIAAGLPVSRPAVSQHLKVLKDAGLVRDWPQGTRRLYQVDGNGLGELRAWLDRFWDQQLAAFQAEVERVPEPAPAPVQARKPKPSTHSSSTSQPRKRKPVL